MSLTENSSAYASGAATNLAGILASKIQEKWTGKLDFDGNGGVSQNEFQTALQVLSEKLDVDLSQEGQAMFAGADMDGDGELRQGEMGALMSNLFGAQQQDMFGTMGNTQNFVQARGGDCHSCGHQISAFDRMDFNQDGFLSRGEFNSMQQMMGPTGGYGTLGMYGAPIYGAGYGAMPMPSPSPYGAMPYGGAPVYPGVSSVTSGAFHEPSTGHTTATVPAQAVASGQTAPSVDTATTATDTTAVPDTTVAANDSAEQTDPLASLVAGLDADGDGQVSQDELTEFVARMEGMVNTFNETQLASAAADQAFNSENAA